MTDYGALSTMSDVTTLRLLRQTRVIDAINLHAAVNYQYHECMYVSLSLCLCVCVPSTTHPFSRVI